MDKSLSQTYTQGFWAQTPRLNQLHATKPENCFLKDKTTWLGTSYWSTLSTKQTKPENQPDKSPLTSLRLILALLTTRLSLSTGWNLVDNLVKDRPSLVPRPLRGWMTLQDPCLKTHSTGLPNKFWTSLFANVKVVNLMQSIILGWHLTTNWQWILKMHSR